MFVAFLAFGFIMQAVQGDDTPNKPIPACEFEDGSGQRSCYWDAETMGNGRGNDYVKVATP
jgi:hypothetical protein